MSNAGMPKATAKIFRAAHIDTADLVHVHGYAIHASEVSGDAWLDPEQGLLMFVSTTTGQVRRFMYYIGEERNTNVAGVGRDIAAFRVDEERIDWLIERLQKAGVM